MHGNIQAPPSGQATPSLGDLAAAIRNARAQAADAFSIGIRHVCVIGDKLKVAKKLAGHGRWLEFLKACDLNERTARQYMHLADLAAKSAPGTDLTGMSIKAAIKSLSPPSSTKAAAPKTPTTKVSVVKVPAVSRRTGHTDIISAWMTATPTERVKAFDAIGLDQVLAAMPASWWPLLQQSAAPLPAAPRPAASLAAIPEDLSIPESLKRPLPAAPRPAAEKAAAMHGDGPHHSVA